MAESNLQNTILEIYGPNSPEYREHKHVRIWASEPATLSLDPFGYGGPVDENQFLIDGKTNGRTQTIGIINGLINRLEEQRQDLEGGETPSPSSYFEKLNLHPRIGDVARELFLDGHHFEAVFAGAKPLVNFVKERSGCYDLDGAPLMRTVFSKNDPVLRFNELKDKTDLDEQEGFMHLFEGAVLSIRNPGGHSFPEGSEQRAIEYISLLSLLAYLAQEAKKTPRKS